MYSFGIILWEMIFNSKPWTNVHAMKVTQLVCSGSRPPVINIPSNVPSVVSFFLLFLLILYLLYFAVHFTINVIIYYLIV